MLRQVSRGMQRSAMLQRSAVPRHARCMSWRTQALARSGDRGFNGWHTYGFWYAAWTGAVSVAGLLICKIWGPKLGEIDPPIKKGHKDLRTGEVHYFQPRSAQPPTTDEPTHSSESDARR